MRYVIAEAISAEKILFLIKKNIYIIYLHTWKIKRNYLYKYTHNLFNIHTCKKHCY